jgi:hypothetical protein
MLQNDINYILKSYLCSLTWYQSFNSQAITSSNLIILIYLIKIKHKIIWIYTNFKFKKFSFKKIY